MLGGMREYTRNIIKNTIVGAVVGVLLSFVLPPFAHAIGLPEAAGQVGHMTWMAGFFGAISGATTAIQPVFDWAFRDKSKDGSLSPRLQTEKEAPSPVRGTPAAPELQQTESIRIAAVMQEPESFSAVAAEHQRRATLASGTAEPTLH